MNTETTIYRCNALAIGGSILAQIIQTISTVSPGVGGWFLGVTAVGLIAVGVATLLQFQLSQWLIDGTAIALGIVGGVWL